MASYRNPKGAVVRLPPDWNLANLAFSSIFDGGLGPGSSNLGLNNIDTQGRYYVIWDCTVAIGPVDPTHVPAGNAAWEINIAPITGSVFPVGNINPIGPVPTGQMVDGYNLSGLFFNRPLYQVLEGPGVWEWSHDWPMAVVPSGYSLICEFGWNNANVSLSVLYEITGVL